jgi:hypothetical protein
MATIDRVPLGAPGVYVATDVPLRVLTGERMDVCAFAGIAPRGPVRVPAPFGERAATPARVESDHPRSRSVPVPVDSWSEYLREFGGFEGPGRLPYAVASFFDNGGRRAWIVRIVHDYGDPARDLAGAGAGVVPGLTPAGGAAFAFAARPTETVQARVGAIVLPRLSDLPQGSLLRLTLPDGSRVLRVASLVFERGHAERPEVVLEAVLDAAVAQPPELVEVVTAKLTIDDGAGREERHEGLGLTPNHPRWIAQVLCEESRLVWPVAGWIHDVLAPDSAALAAPPQSGTFSGGEDRWADVVPEDFFDPSWTGTVEDDDRPTAGVHAVADVREVAMLAAPDLYSPGPLAEAESVVAPPPRSPYFVRCETEDTADADPVRILRIEPPVGPTSGGTEVVLRGEGFAVGGLMVRFGGHTAGSVVLVSATEVRCTTPPRASAGEVDVRLVCAAGGSVVAQGFLYVPGMANELAGLALDPGLPGDLDTIVGLQERLVAFAEAVRGFAVLLDVPPGLRHRQVLTWRTRLSSMWAAAYHPWIRVARLDDGRDALVRVNPSSIAAGIIARQETAFGVPHGPANVLAVHAVDVDERIPPGRHDELHQVSINVFLRERDGVLLTAGRTLSRDPSWRQLSVRRLVTMVERALDRQMQWTVFEPNGRRLRAQVSDLLRTFLRSLWRANAFAGATEDEAFFVRCDDALNPPSWTDRGRLLVEVGLAPAEPLEFIVLRLTRDGDRLLVAEAGAA